MAASGYSWKNYTATNGTGDILANGGPGVLHTVDINTGAACTVTLYDGLSASGKPIAVVTALAGSGPAYLLYDLIFNVGLFAVVGGTPGNLTITWN